MDYLQNHIWCNDSNWGGVYHCRHMVSLYSYRRGYEIDWKILVDENSDSFVDTAFWAKFKELHEDIPINYDKLPKKTVPNFRPEVLKWLEENIKDREGGVHGWCVGSSKYRSETTISLDVFFHRKADAMRFIKTFSVWKKPIRYCQYFTDVRKTLNLETGKYQEDTE